jgi:hypothetical protein
LAFYDSALSDGKVLTAFSTMLRSIIKERYRNIYILWGLHFTSLVSPPIKSDDTIIAGLATSYFLWMKKFTTTKDEEIKRNSFPIVRFLMSEIRRRLTPERLLQMLGDKLTTEEGEIERSSLLGEEPRIDELIVTTEIDPPR